ncbi:MAG: hypothetical protein AABY22_01795 [Nanoarchaeota archaeon]
MTYLYLAPNWFIKTSIILEVIFALVCTAVALYSFKVYRLTEQREHRLFGTAFASIAVSYFIWVFLNIFFLTEIGEGVDALVVEKLNLLNLFGIYSHIFFFSLGLVTLAYTVLKVKNLRIYSLLLVLMLFAVVLSKNMSTSFFLLSSIFLFFISIHYLEEYLKNKSNRKLMIFTAFLFLFLGFLDLTFSIRNYINYIVGHFLELVAYIIILISLVISIKK